jgi:hypothetical protein
MLKLLPVLKPGFLICKGESRIFACLVSHWWCGDVLYIQELWKLLSIVHPGVVTVRIAA